MNLKVFIDSDIVLDLFARREPHYRYAAQLFTLIDREIIDAYTSPLIFANTHYFLKKYTSNNFALQSLRKLKAMVHILPIDNKIVEQSLNSDFNAFEDAIQYYTAVSNGIRIILTRNVKDYKPGAITVSTPEEFIKMWQTHREKSSIL